jgi:hypothetical protein
LIEAGKSVYLSGTLHNIMNEEELLQVDRIGPVVSWEKPHGNFFFLIFLKIENINIIIFFSQVGNLLWLL